MRIAYKLRNKGTETNDWIIAVIYDVDGWPGRSLTHKGLNEYQFARDMTDVEKKDFQANGTRLTFVAYKSIEGFIEDEKLCGVDDTFIDKICKFFNHK